MGLNISTDTLEILKNFSQINQNLLIKEGNKLSTIAAMKNVLAFAEVSEDFPVQCGIYDLNEFLGVVSLFDTPDIEFKKDHMLIEEGPNRSKYFFADESLLVLPPKKKLEMPNVVIEFVLEEADYNFLVKAAATMQLPDLTLSSNGKKMRLSVHDKKVKTSHDYSIEVGDSDTKFEMNFKSENMKILPGNYDVEVAKEKIARFMNQDVELQYFIALEPDSVYDN